MEIENESSNFRNREQNFFFFVQTDHTFYKIEWFILSVKRTLQEETPLRNTLGTFMKNLKSLHHAIIV